MVPCRLAGWLLVALCALLCACVPSVHPLAGDGNVAESRALLGVWRAQEGDVRMVFVSGPEPGSMRMIYSEKGDSPVRFRINTVKLGDRVYVDFHPELPRPYADNVFVGNHVGVWHTFARFEVVGGQMRLWLADARWMDRHLQDKPAALAHFRDERRVVLTADTAALQAFVRQNDGLFAGEASLFRRE